MQRKLLEIISVDIDATSQLLIIYSYSAFVKYLKKKWEYSEAVHRLFINFKKAYDSVRREVLYNILIEFGIPIKVVRLIKMCLNETCSRVRVGKELSVLLRKFETRGCFIVIYFQLCFRICRWKGLV